MRYFVLLLISLLSNVLLSQEKQATADTLKLDSIPKDTVIKYWKNKCIFGTNGSQTSFVNWSAGGRNNISVLGFVDASLVYKKKNIKWSNDLKFSLGGLKYTDSVGLKSRLQKTDDKIDVNSTFGYKFKKNFYYTVTTGFKTQSLNGFNFPNDSVRISGWLAPAYINLSIGIEYAPKETFNVYLSPVAGKTTLVMDQQLANQGAFGVTRADTNALGQITTFGKNIRHEFGAYFRFKFQKEIIKNVEMKTKAELFSNYIKNPQNIDVNVENIFVFKVNKYMSSSIQWNIIYDDDIKIKDRYGNIGPRLQFKSVFGLGVSFTLKN